MTEQEIQQAKWDDKISFVCDFCGNISQRTKRRICSPSQKSSLNIFCSLKCVNSYSTHKGRVTMTCRECGLTFSKVKSQISKNNFCTQSCAAKHNNRHKTKGFRRSKIEIFIQNQLKLEPKYRGVVFSERSLGDFEIDFYFPQKKIAIELNGIFHYKPIYGAKSFERILKTDAKKKKFCKDNGIDLLIIDISKNIFHRLSHFEKVWYQVKAFIDFCDYFE